MQADIIHVSIAFPSAESSKFGRVCLDIANADLRSHPKLPRSSAFSSGLGSRKEFPSSEDDLVFNRTNILDNLHNIHHANFRIAMEIEWTVQFDPNNPPQRALFLPKNTLDISLSLANLKASIPGQPKVCVFSFFPFLIFPRKTKFFLFFRSN